MNRLLIVGVLLVAAGFAVLGCDTGSAPTTPELFGPDTAAAGDTIKLRLWSKDQDDDYISFTIRWGDGTPEEVTPFTAMLDTLRRTHVFEAAGSFGITARAQDINGKKSGWSDTLRITVMP